jgi:hypothetical protein
MMWAQTPSPSKAPSATRVPTLDPSVFPTATPSAAPSNASAIMYALLRKCSSASITQHVATRWSPLAAPWLPPRQ